jgi:hypothetical protein
MISTTIILHGISVSLCYEWYSPDKIEWCLDEETYDVLPNTIFNLLEILLRRHYNNKISLLLWDEHQARVYEEDAKAATLAEDMPF